MADVSLNGLKVKTDSLPNDWYVSLINPKSEEPAEIMTVAKFIELFLTNNKVWTANNDGPDSKLDADLLDGKDGYSYVSNLGRITDLNKISYNSVYNYSNGAVNAPNTYGVVLSLANWSKFEEGKQDQWLNQLAFGTNNTIYFRQKINTEDWTQWRTVGLNTSAYSLNANALTDTISENYSILPPPPQIACQTVQNQQVRASNLRCPLSRRQTTRMVQFQLEVNHRNSMSGQSTRSEKLSWNYKKKTRDLNKSSISLTIARYNKCNLPRAGPPRLIN